MAEYTTLTTDQILKAADLSQLTGFHQQIPVINDERFFAAAIVFSQEPDRAQLDDFAEHIKSVLHPFNCRCYTPYPGLNLAIFVITKKALPRINTDH